VVSARRPVVRERGLVAKMPDGCRLVADVWLPEGPGPHPALLQRLPYGRSVASSPVLPSPAQLARLGYAVVVQDVRGTGDSDGRFVPFVAEADDGAATIEWVSAQPFCDGNVAMYGFSYQGLNQLQAAALRPEGLRAIAPMMCAAEPYDLLYDQGCLKWSFAASWAAQLSGLGGSPRRAEQTALPLAAALGPDPPGWFLDWLAHDTRDAYWQALAPDLDAIDVPVFTIIGYADTFATGTVRLAGELAARMVCGPWAHMPWGTRLGELELGPEAGPATAVEAFLAFLAEVLPDPAAAPTTPCPDPAVSYYVVGHGWRNASSWPPPGQRRLLVATSDNGANSRHGDGRLVPDEGEALVSVGELGDLIVPEPLVPVPGTADPYPDVAAVEDRRDVLCYTAAPETEAVVIAGSPVARVIASVDGSGLDLVAGLVVVEGHSARRIAHGASRLSGPAGTQLEAVIQLTPIAWQVPAGAAIRLEVSASRFPLYARHPQAAGGPVAERTPSGYAVGTVEVHSASLELAVED
jgi:uncharacterized protein